MENNQAAMSESSPRDAVLFSSMYVCRGAPEPDVGLELEEQVESGGTLVVSEAHSAQLAWCGSSHSLVSRYPSMASCVPLIAGARFLIMDECSMYFPVRLMEPESCCLYIGDVWDLWLPSSLASELQTPPLRVRCRIDAGSDMTVNESQGLTVE